MSVSRSNSGITVSAFVVAAIGVAACERTSGTEPVADHLSHATVPALAGATPFNAVGLANDVRTLTAQYQSKKLASKAGYVENPACVEHPTLGGMGHHWANGALIDPVFQPTKPEVMLYEPDQSGKLQLVAVEYIVINIGQPAPTFGGQAFDVGGTPVPVPHWSLHVWVHKSNPAGMFTPFNPTVDCP